MMENQELIYVETANVECPPAIWRQLEMGANNRGCRPL